MSQAPIDRLRAICLALPEAEERETWEKPTFRVRDKIFAMSREDAGRLAVWFKAPRGAQEVLVGAAPQSFFRPPYVGPKGWVGMWLEGLADGGPDWAEVRGLVERSYTLVAPRRLAERLQGQGEAREQNQGTRKAKAKGAA